MSGVAVDGARLWQWLMSLADITEPDRPWTRRAFTAHHAAGREWLAARMRELDLQVRVDAAGNLIGRREGRAVGARTLMIGSHSDTVAGGGRFDGIAGVVAGLEVAAQLRAGGWPLRYALEIVDFLAEEPNPYGLSCIGSRGMAGALDNEMLARNDQDGIALSRRLLEAGAGDTPITAAVRHDIEAFLELHIEQGPVLEQQGVALGIVSHIVGIRRLGLRFVGQAAHAGTTPYALRKDALVAAARFVAELPAFMQAAPQPGPYLVATVGELALRPNAANVVPREVRLTVDLRSDDAGALADWAFRVEEFAARIAAASAVALAPCEMLSASEPAACAPTLSAVLARAAQGLGFSCRHMVSGAGHDAAFIARVAPMAMLFVPSRDGNSHTADEWTTPEQLTAGVATLLAAVLEIDTMNGAQGNPA